MMTKFSGHNFSVAFEQMCSIVAIGKTKSHEETLTELIIQCIAIFPDEKFASAQEIQKVINGIFGLDIVVHEIEDIIIRLKERGVLTDVGFLVLSESSRSEVEAKIEKSNNLENSVKETWQEELSEKYPGLNFQNAWHSLQKYLAFAFQRHGIQAISLLNPAIEIPEDYTNSLSSILSSVIYESFEKDQQIDARNAISEFMATTGNTPTRAQYISQLADGAFIYFNLTVPPEVATNFQEKLNHLSIFLDTNFLFGILGIDVGPQVAVSNELIRVINDFNLPFTLLAHEKTIQELVTSINSKERELKSRNWSKSISRAAAQSRYLSGVELMYHQRYAESGIDVESFFAPYKHPDLLIAEKGIEIYTNHETDRHEVHLLIAEYQDFLDDLNKSKIYELIDHDMTVLHRVKSLRSERKSTLDARAIFMTCDFTLYRFDSNYCKKQGNLVSTVLPNVFWQIIRPYIPSNEMFDKAFAETFAIPEFRTIDSSAAKACSKMVHILAGFKDFPEETATKMLSNDLLIQQLELAETDQEFQAFVDAEIIRENEALLDKNKELMDHINRKENVLKENEKKLEISQTEIEKLSSTIRTKDEVISEFKMENSHTTKKLGDLQNENVVLKNILHIIILVIAGLFAVGLTEALIFLIPIDFVLDFGRPILLQVIINIFVVTLVLGFLDKKSRKLWWGGSFISFIINFFTFLANLPLSD